MNGRMSGNQVGVAAATRAARVIYRQAKIEIRIRPFDVIAVAWGRPAEDGGHELIDAMAGHTREHALERLIARLRWWS